MRYLVRVAQADKERASGVFDIEKIIDAAVKDEFAFITAPMAADALQEHEQKVVVLGKMRIHG
jgi:hypothetical protein